MMTNHATNKMLLEALVSNNDDVCFEDFEGNEVKDIPESLKEVVFSRLFQYVWSDKCNKYVNAYDFIAPLGGKTQLQPIVPHPFHVCTADLQKYSYYIGNNKDGEFSTSEYFAFWQCAVIGDYSRFQKWNPKAHRVWTDHLFGPDSIYKKTVLNHAIMIRLRNKKDHPVINGMFLGFIIPKENWSSVDHFAMTNLMINSRWIYEKYHRVPLFMKFLKDPYNLPVQLAFCLTNISSDTDEFCPSHGAFVGGDGHMGIRENSFGSRALDRFLFHIPTEYQSDYKDWVIGVKRKKGDEYSHLYTDSPTLTIKDIDPKICNWADFWTRWKDNLVKSNTNDQFRYGFFGTRLQKPPEKNQPTMASTIREMVDDYTKVRKALLKEISKRKDAVA